MKERYAWLLMGLSSTDMKKGMSAYAVAKKLGLPYSTIYPTIARLAKFGLVNWDRGHKGVANVSITPKGVELANLLGDVEYFLSDLGWNKK